MVATPKVELFFDVGSPYSYLAMTQVHALRERIAAPVRLRPFLLGGVFKATGNTPPALIASKGRFMLTDLHRWAEQYRVPFQMNSHFPINTLAAQRVLTAAELGSGEEAMERLAHRVARAVWAEDSALDGDELAFCVNECGLEVSSIVAAIREPAVKERLRTVTEEAVSRGAFGAPTWFVGDAMFFGNDRLHHLEELLGRAAGAT